MVVGSHAERTAGNEPHVGLLLASGRRRVRVGKTHGDLTLSGGDDSFPPHQQHLGAFRLDQLQSRNFP
jgi:hypothetical protein